MSTHLSLTGLSPSLAGFPKTILLDSSINYTVRTPACTHAGLGSSGFARRYSRNRCFLLFLSLLRCFSSGGSPPYVMYWRMDTTNVVGFPIQISPDQWIFAPPRSFSQLITSFIGSQCQGIHPALLMLDLYSWSAAIIALMTGFCVLCFKSN